ncbi:hypothetical protein HK107_06695 [Parvularcula sp. ZS-1/3]|uniref:CBU-0592-like domain-containing protein n=1 Tax=Parvularcula mediterranea TaxID=2732508 RepID=A0A7Y3RKZ7_9PROT|nr:hypothetical protein [Parvularcula mediterranea]NNU16007.1 hypothetical protein [Parvularcula mediterranea]
MILALGWLGLTLYAAAHLLLILRDGRDRRLYFSINLVAAIVFTASAIGLSSWQSMAINIFWALTSVLGLADRERILSGLGRGLTLATLLLSALLLAVSGAGVFPFADGLGWTGALIYSLAYFLLAEERINRRRYLLLNVIAAVVLIPVYNAQENWPALWMSIVWTVISGGGYLRVTLTKRGGA